jgi:hypothetical protein
MKKEALKYILGLLVVFFGLLATSSNALGQGTTGVTDKEILIGSCSAGRAVAFLRDGNREWRESIFRHDQ